VPGLGHIYKGHILAGLLWMIGAIPVGIFVFLAAFASAGWGLGLFFFYLAAVMLHAYGIEDRVLPPKEDEGEEHYALHRTSIHRDRFTNLVPQREFLPEYRAFRIGISSLDNAPGTFARR